MKKIDYKKIKDEIRLLGKSKMRRAGLVYGSDKLTYHGYERFYDYFLAGFKNKKFNFFEVGVEGGSSIKMWKRYFLRAKIYGMDIGHEYKHSRGEVFKGDQSKIADLKKIVRKTKVSDFIIDDGSHVPEHQLLTYNYLFKNLLNWGGVYIIEDIETSYWTNTKLYNYTVKSGYGKNNNIVNIFKEISDIVNREYLNSVDMKKLIKKSQVTESNLKYISSIMFGQNCIIITKMTKDQYSRYGKRKYRFGDQL